MLSSAQPSAIALGSLPVALLAHPWFWMDVAAATFVPADWESPAIIFMCVIRARDLAVITAPALQREEEPAIVSKHLR